MRWIIAAMLIAAAGQVAAQPASQADVDYLRMQQEAAQRAAVAQSNQLMSLEARLRADQAVVDLRAQTNGPAAPTLLYGPESFSSPVAPAATAKYPSIPDAMLADSNRRVREASKPPR